MIDVNIIIYVLGGVVAILLAWVISLELRLKKLFGGKKPNNMENLLADIKKELERLGNNQVETGKYLALVEKRLNMSVRNISVVRFNPFKEAGSNQSFAIALLDERGNGAVISSLYSREKVNVYAKSIKNGQSEYQLTAEEKEAINQASQ